MREHVVNITLCRDGLMALPWSAAEMIATHKLFYQVNDHRRPPGLHAVLERSATYQIRHAE